MNTGFEPEPERRKIITPRLQLVAWELTRNCNLFCEHCRGSSGHIQYQDELTTEECHCLIGQILEVGKPIIILTGGEPLLRDDIVEIGRYAVDKGLTVVIGTNGTLITTDMAASLKKIPISRIGISLDFPHAELQDRFRGQDGAFAAAMDGIANARDAGIEVQINSTITSLNVAMLDELINLALDMGAVAFHPFLLVPTGRGRGLKPVELSAEQYEATLNWIYDRQQELGDSLFFKPTDAPQYMRIVKQRQKTDKVAEGSRPGGGHSAGTITRGCLAGTGFAFISHQGKAKGCGYLDVVAGDVRQQSFAEIWADSPLFRDLRNLANLKGKCGVCEYKRVCGGCRARAYEATGDYLEAEPYCIHVPAVKTGV
jgi:heme b synthase